MHFLQQCISLWKAHGNGVENTLKKEYTCIQTTGSYFSYLYSMLATEVLLTAQVQLL